MSVQIYYNGECPFCTHYVSHLRLREAVGAPTLINLREDREARAALERDGFDLDQGMVADIDGRRYGGADAMHALALLSTGSGWFNRLNAILFSSDIVARRGYPLLRAGRNAALLFLAREAIRPGDSQVQSLFTLFSLMFGLFGLMHFGNQIFRYTPFNGYLSTWLIMPLATGLLLNPGSRRVFTALILVMVVDAWLQAPIYSNHTILKNFLLLALLGSGIWHWVRGSCWDAFFMDAVPVGRVLLLMMYFFGIFHKINTGFLDPAVSCAVALWRMMPAPLRWFDDPLIHSITIYGTFIAEGSIMAMLLIPAMRHWGIVCGIGFHTLLALSGYAMYPAFSTLSIALHILFLSPAAADRIVQHDSVQRGFAHLRSLLGYLLVAACLIAIALNAIIRDYTMVAVVWLVLAVPPCLAIVCLGGRTAETPAHGRLLWSRLSWLNIVALLFFLNGVTPYLGLKTSQSINMFANLRLEAGESNHLLLPWAPVPFDYLEDVVEITEASGSTYLQAVAQGPYHLVYYHLLNVLDRNPEATVSYVRAGNLHTDQTAASLAEDIDAILHPRWVRKWFHFYPVDLRSPKPCGAG